MNLNSHQSPINEVGINTLIAERKLTDYHKWEIQASETEQLSQGQTKYGVGTWTYDILTPKSIFFSLYHPASYSTIYISVYNPLWQQTPSNAYIKVLSNCSVVGSYYLVYVFHSFQENLLANSPHTTCLFLSPNLYASHVSKPQCPAATSSSNLIFQNFTQNSPPWSLF